MGKAQSGNADQELGTIAGGRNTSTPTRDTATTERRVRGTLRTLPSGYRCAAHLVVAFMGVRSLRSLLYGVTGRESAATATVSASCVRCFLAAEASMG